MNEELLAKILEMNEKGMSWQEIAKRFPHAHKELEEIKTVIELLERSRKDVAPSTHLLSRILENIPGTGSAQPASGFSRFTAMFLKFGAPLAIAAATFVLVLTLKAPASPEQQSFDQIALKMTEDSAAGTGPTLMAVPEGSRQADVPPTAPAPSGTSAADQAADQALASGYDDGSGSDAAMNSYFDPAAVNAYDQSVSNNPI